MNPRIFAAASLLTALAGSLPAADPQLLKLVMPDVKVISDVNVAQAKLTPFGQYVLAQVQNAGAAQVTALTNFDPAKDLTELLCASNGTEGAGLALATGIFDPLKIAAVAAKEGSVSEIYQGVTILEDPKKINGAAFLNTGLLVAGDIANIKAAIGRQTSPTTLSAALLAQIAMLSNTEDAWILSTVPLSTLHPSAPATATTKKPDTVDGIAIPPNVLQQIQSGYAGVKFGANITVTAQAQTSGAQDATNLAGLFQLIQNIAQMQAAQSPDAAAFARSVAVTAQGSTVNLSASMPQDQFQKLVQPKRVGHAAQKK
jgi:hypothetical protein